MWKYFLNLWFFAALGMIFVGAMGKSLIFIVLGVIALLISFGTAKKDDNSNVKNK